MPALQAPRLAPNRPGSSMSNSSQDEEVLSGRAWARTVNNPWDPLILTLDGGGIRGYSSLLILKQLMHEIAAWENKLEKEEGPIPGSARHTFNEDELLPCHYFDYMYGTSTGGLIATMLGRLRMSVLQCLRIYVEVGDDLFGRRRSRVPLATKYDHKPLESAVQKIVRLHCKEHPPGECDGKDWHPWKMAAPGEPEPENVDRICQSICLTATHNGRIDEAYLLRTYPHHYESVPNWITIYNDGADPMRIWQVTRATSAAPFFFKILEADIRGELRSFKDGGIRENNPAGAAWSEFVSAYGEDKDPALLLSIGTGRPNEDHDGFASAWPGPFGHLKLTKKAAEKFAVFKNVLIKYTEGEEKHKSMVRLAKGEHRWYKRLNVSTGLETMKLDNWKRGPWRDPHASTSTSTSAQATIPIPVTTSAPASAPASTSTSPPTSPPTSLKALPTTTTKPASSSPLRAAAAAVAAPPAKETPPPTVNGGASLSRMDEATAHYLRRDLDRRFDTYAPPRVMIAQVAEKLVRHRRARELTRADDPKRWETFMGMWLTGERRKEDGVVRHDAGAPGKRGRRTGTEESAEGCC